MSEASELGMAEDASEEMMYGCDGGVPLCPPPLGHQRSTSMRLEDPDSPPMYRSLAQGSSSAMLDDGYDDGYDDVPVYRSIVGVGCLEVATHAVADHALEEDMSCRGYAGYGHAGSWGQLKGSASADYPEAYPEAHAYRGLSALLSSTHVEAASRRSTRGSTAVPFYLPLVCAALVAVADRCCAYTVFTRSSSSSR